MQRAPVGFRCGASLPLAKLLFEQRLQLRQFHIAGDDERRVTGKIVLPPKRGQFFSFNGLQRIRGANVRIAVRIFRSIQRDRVNTRGHRKRIVLLLHQRRFPLGANTIDFGLRESGMKNYVGEQFQEIGEISR